MRVVLLVLGEVNLSWRREWMAEGERSLMRGMLEPTASLVMDTDTSGVLNLGVRFLRFETRIIGVQITRIGYETIHFR